MLQKHSMTKLRKLLPVVACHMMTLFCPHQLKPVTVQRYSSGLFRDSLFRYCLYIRDTERERAPLCHSYSHGSLKSRFSEFNCNEPLETYKHCSLYIENQEETRANRFSFFFCSYFSTSLALLYVSSEAHGLDVNFCL